MKKYLSGFTLVELLVVISIISILAAVIYANFNDARKLSRDKMRQSSLKELQLAIELYKSQYGTYPDPGCGASGWVGPGPGDKYPACSEYIVGLAPEYISELPVDPNQEDEPDSGFLYSVNSDRSAYKVLVWRTVETDTVENYDHPFARCPRSYDTGQCGDSGPEKYTYSIYSVGRAGN